MIILKNNGLSLVISVAIMYRVISVAIMYRIEQIGLFDRNDFDQPPHQTLMAGPYPYGLVTYH